MQIEAGPRPTANIRGIVALLVIVLALGVGIYFVSHKAAKSGPAVLTGSPLEHPMVLHNEADYTAASNATVKLAAGPFQKVDRGEPLNRADVDAVYQAARLYSAMTTYRPKQPGTDFTCGQCLSVLGYDNDAIKKFKQFLAYIGPRPDSDNIRVMGADAHGLMSQSYFKLKDYKSAKEEATTALGIFPNTPTYLADRAQAELKLGEIPAAKADIQQALAGDPDNKLAKTLSGQVS